MKKSILFLSAVVAIMTLYSCATPKDITYFQDFEQGMSMTVQNPLEIKLRPDDRITIKVSTRDNILSNLFSLNSSSTITNNQITGNNTGNNNNNRESEYTIDAQGFIHFPVLGKVYVQGMNRQEIADNLEKMLLEKNLVKDPIVTVDFANLYVIVLGDVGNGRVQIDRDKFSILDALSKCGDLSITGKRQNVKVIRDSYGKKTVYEVNLCSAHDLYASPVYYLQQNDVIYVEPNDKKKRNATEIGNSMMQPTFWFSLFSFGVAIANLLK